MMVNLKTFIGYYGITISLLLYCLAFCTDFYTTFINRHILDVIELNPLYNTIGLSGIFVLNIIYMLAMYLMYKYSNVTIRFAVINALILSVLIRIIYIRNALTWYGNTKTVEEIAQVITPAIKEAAQIQMYALHLLPIIISLITFWIYKLDHKIKKL